MRYAILCYNSEQLVGVWSEEKDKEVMTHHAAVERRLAEAGKIGPVVRLMPTTTATTVRSGRQALVIDGPFAESKEQLLGFYVVDCATLQEAIDIAGELAIEPGAMEIRPIMHFSDLSKDANPATAEARASEHTRPSAATRK